jgi:pyrimidine-nucleoside phosphorylase
VSLPLAPLVASLGLRDPMISGRGLGHTGGTLDKLETIPGFRTDVPVPRFMEIVDTVGCAIVGQTGALVPADKKLYALRDVTATVDSIPLIASSILSKKRASGISALVQDVKFGSGAFMKTQESAAALAREMVGLGAALGLRVTAFLTDMGQPLGVKCGNALEVAESIEVLKGGGPADLVRLVEEFAVAMLRSGGVEGDRDRALERIRGALASGAALERFARMVEAQGGDPRVCDDPQRLPSAAGVAPFTAGRSGTVSFIDVERVGQAIVVLGGGRRRMEDRVDPGVGLEVFAKVGDRVDAGDVLAKVHYSETAKLEEARAMLASAYEIGDTAVAQRPLIAQVIGG